MTNHNNTGSLTAQIDKLHKEVSVLKNERQVLFFIASCGVSNAVLQFSLIAAVILIVVSFSFCFLEDIIKGE
jgi:Ni/Fe-hydrogenase subunit HybB-like protein